MYEETIGREAYNYFKRDYDLGKSRLFGKKQQAMKKLQNIEETKEENIKDKKEIVNGEKNEAVEEAKCNANDEILKEKFCLFCCRKFGSFCTAKPENPIKNEDQK